MEAANEETGEKDYAVKACSRGLTSWCPAISTREAGLTESMSEPANSNRDACITVSMLCKNTSAHLKAPTRKKGGRNG
jgi:hypothetical protein